MTVGCTHKCLFVVNTTRFDVKNEFIVGGENIDFNAAFVKAKTFDFLGIRGNAQLNDFNIQKKANISLVHGDIILQSKKDYAMNWTLSLPSYCYASPKFSNTTINGCKPVNLQPIFDAHRDALAA